MSVSIRCDAPPPLPCWEEMSEAERQGFMNGMQEFQGLFDEMPKMKDVIGVLIIDPDGSFDARVITKNLAAKRARSVGMENSMVEAIISPPMAAGALDILLLCGSNHTVFSVSVEIVSITMPDPDAPKN